VTVLGQTGLKGVIILQLAFVGAVDTDSAKNPRHGQSCQDEVGKMNLKGRARSDFGESSIQKTRCVI